RGEPDKGNAGDQPGAAHQDQRRQAMIFRLVGGTDGANHADEPYYGKDRLYPFKGGWFQSEPGTKERPEAGQKGKHHQDAELRLKTARTEKGLDGTRPAPGDGDQYAFEDALPPEAAQAGWSLFTSR